MFEKLHSDKYPKKSLKQKAKFGGMILLAASAGAVGGNTLGNGPSVSEQAKSQLEDDIALHHAVKVLDGGKAIVHMSDGRTVTVINPMLADNGAVAERPRDSKPLGQGEAGGLTVTASQVDKVTSYVEGENGVESIDYYSLDESGELAALHQNGSISKEKEAIIDSETVELDLSHDDKSFVATEEDKEKLENPNSRIGFGQ